MRRHYRGPGVAALAFTLASCIGLASCRGETPPPPRGVEALLLSDGTHEDDVARTVLLRHYDLMRALAAHEPRAGDMMAMSFRYRSFTKTGSARTSGLDRDYFQTLGAGLPADVLAAHGHRVDNVGDAFAMVTADVSHTRRVSTNWSLQRGA